ncbi:hypothetical protein Zmor_010156 [Zophobas morio]|uniref:Uncharacterized protein n=1 Tax=Zophobas morio TaxID=2755281 RepID=A0AA38MJK0_9CUCU|nr:hypothetical protein Zmor_010156 [Zophobas morio]
MGPHSLSAAQKTQANTRIDRVDKPTHKPTTARKKSDNPNLCISRGFLVFAGDGSHSCRIPSRHRFAAFIVRVDVAAKKNRFPQRSISGPVLSIRRILGSLEGFEGASVAVSCVSSPVPDSPRAPFHGLCCSCMGPLRA